MIEETVAIKEPDEADLASRLTEVEIAEKLKQRVLPPTKVPDGVQLKESDFECLNCENTIPKPRRLAGYRICIDCARANERLDALYVR